MVYSVCRFSWESVSFGNNSWNCLRAAAVCPALSAVIPSPRFQKSRLFPSWGKPSTMLKSEPARIFLIGSYRLNRAAFRALIESRGSFEVVGEADTCVAALKAIPPSAELLVIDLPDADTHALRDLRKLLALAPKARPLVVAPPIDTATRTQIVRLGAMGLITRDQSAEMLFTAMETVAREHVAWIDRTTMTEVLRTVRPEAAAAARAWRRSGKVRPPSVRAP